ncbi:3480_t:CDS:1, partial [Acaulospora colombiana]
AEIDDHMVKNNTNYATEAQNIISIINNMPGKYNEVKQALETYSLWAIYSKKIFIIEVVIVKLAGVGKGKAITSQCERD